jgi:hypothetical protein
MRLVLLRRSSPGAKPADWLASSVTRSASPGLGSPGSKTSWSPVDGRSPSLSPPLSRSAFGILTQFSHKRTLSARPSASTWSTTARTRSLTWSAFTGCRCTGTYSVSTTRRQLPVRASCSDLTAPINPEPVIITVPSWRLGKSLTSVPSAEKPPNSNGVRAVTDMSRTPEKRPSPMTAWPAGELLTGAGTFGTNVYGLTKVVIHRPHSHGIRPKPVNHPTGNRMPVTIQSGDFPATRLRDSRGTIPSHRGI